MNVRDNSYCASDSALFDLSKLTILDSLPITGVNIHFFCGIICKQEHLKDKNKLN
jgi:hypothetical protein